MYGVNLSMGKEEVTMATPAERRTPLDRDRVLRAAISLVDEGGIESLSMRKLGQALGVEAMALYNHVADKDDILGGIAEMVLNEFELPAGEDDWEAAIRKLAISAHDALVRHPWAASLIMSSSQVLPARAGYIESLLRRLREAGFSPAEASRAYHAIDSHILGFTLWQLGHRMPVGAPRLTTKEEVAVFLATVRPGLSVEDFPYLLEHAAEHIASDTRDEESEFEFGLRLILDGLTRMRGRM
jgi:AcrR family transcriptional regulator